MKKGIALLLTMVMFVIATPACADRWTEWELGYFVDEFGDNTDAWYVARSTPATVYYGNSTSWGRVTIAVSRDLAYIYLYENFVFPDVLSGDLVVNDSSKDVSYDISIKTENGTKYKFIGTMRLRDSVILIIDNMYGFGELLRNNSELSFVVSPAGNNIEKYTFNISGTSNFKDVLPYDRWAEEYEREAARLAEQYTVSNKWGYIDKTGNLIIPFQWDDADYFTEGLAIVRNRDKEGAIDIEGNVVVPFEWNYVGRYSEGVSIVSKAGGKNGVIDREGKLVVSDKWNYIMPASEGALTVYDGNGGYGILDLKGNWLIQLNQLANAGNFHEGLAYAQKQKNGNYGFVDQNGNVVIGFEWNGAKAFSEGLGSVQKGKKWGFIDATSQIIIPCEWDSVGSFNEGLAYVKREEKYGFINTEGTLVIPCEWDDCGNFSEGLAWVQKDDKYGFVDVNGMLVIPCEWENADSFYEGVAQVKKDGKYGFIDTYGNVVIACEWSNATRFSYGLAAVQAP